MVNKIQQIAGIFKSFNPLLHEFIKGNDIFDFIKMKDSSYVVSFINKDINNYNYLDGVLRCMADSYIMGLN